MALFVCLLLVLSLLSPAVYGFACGPADFDISTLTSVPFWYANINAVHCEGNFMSSLDNVHVQVPGQNISKPSNCRLIFSVCKSLPILCPNQGVCKIKGLNSSFEYITWPLNLGTTAAATFHGEKNSFRIEFPDGPKRVCYASKEPQPVKTQITFNCLKSAKWTPKLKTTSPFKGGANAPFLQSVSLNLKKCMYQIVFNSSEGCPDYGPGGSPGSPLSTGSILLILFFPSVFLYCVIGAMINGSRQKSGAQLIPNYNFWTDLPYLVLDGFGFVISIITCSKMVTTNNETYQPM